MRRALTKTVIVIVIAIVLGVTYFYLQFQPSQNPQFGLSFSVPYVQHLGFDWKTAYLDMLNDLRPQKLRLMAYWDMVEPQQDKFDFQIMDEMLIEAGKRKIEVILVLGRKQPRWPECHEPKWVKQLSSEALRNQRQLAMVEAAVQHFRQFDAIKVWQVENEPLFEFGYECPRLDKKLVEQEIRIVKNLDSRPVMVTDSGEKGSWSATVKLGGGIFGSTMYRTVYQNRLGYYQYPLPPAFFRIKAGWLTKFSQIKKIIGVELQAEPWFTSGVNETELQTQFRLMNPKIFERNVNFAKKVGFEENYLWGVEWWYWLAKEKGDWGMWQAAKELLSSS
ncbi:MAG: beta-galactosidase [Candidatus Doudnabacteria bacterium]|nr:beta-galactosidase [Candidatus Doudnabacteria bacterium]